MYYNTTNETGETLDQLWQKCENQQQFVYELFCLQKAMTASEAWKLYPDDIEYQTPLTSIRRAITDLMNEGKLVKTEIKKTGIYGKPEYVYKVAETQMQLF